MSRRSSLSRSNARRNALGLSGYPRAGRGSPPRSAGAASRAGPRSGSAGAPASPGDRGTAPTPGTPYTRRRPTAGRGAAAKNSGIVAGPRPIVVTREARGREHGGHVGPLDHRRPADADARGGRRQRHHGVGRRPGRARWTWWLTPRWRSRGSAPQARSTGATRAPGAASSDAGHLDRGRAERVRGADDAGPHADDDDVGADDVRGPGRGPTGTDTASRSPPKAWPAVMVPSRTPRAPQVGDEVAERQRQRGAVGHHVGDAGRRAQVRDDGGDHGDLAVQRARHDRHARSSVAGRSGWCSSAAPVSAWRLV